MTNSLSIFEFDMDSGRPQVNTNVRRLTRVKAAGNAPPLSLPLPAVNPCVIY